VRRREFITHLGSAAAGWPLAARAQQPKRMRQIGVLMAYVGPVAQSEFKSFQGALTKLGGVGTGALIPAGF
jgi:putative ABC transport system substrate-binding protein